ncbi:hypothetical protein OH76DRAFT_1411067 [Lentinus brumalis]|uniref:Uncharacterized protein n=1 Tax=Lentinus brumalis TaxID=2498619 RepID=A0A371CQB4_9APHY|nr:hypothetical protein OH76DRAFT_1411067 [Polyporus brumalis]
MAAYYAQRPPLSHSRPSASKENGRSAARERNEDLTSLNVISPDNSIYIFPSPSSAPPSPYPNSPGSSLFSPPTEFDPSEPFSFGDRSRASSNAASASHADRGVALARRRATTPLGDDELEIDVELWELSTSTDPIADVSASDSSWVLEDEIGRVGAGDVDFSYVNVRRNHRLTSPRSSDAPPYWAARRRSRTHSRIRTLSSLSSPLSSTSTSRPAPHPRVHIPLLSFFSSLLSIDMDDPALRLLTHTEPGEAESILFPGHTTAQLLASDDAESPARDNEGETDADTDASSSASHAPGEQPHGLPKLLLASISDQSTVALRSLRAGLAVYIAHSSDVALPLPRPGELFGLWRVVGEVCARSSQAWREVWGAGSPGGDTLRGPAA